MNGFCHVSMLIDLDFESWPPAPEAYTDTAGYFPRRSRALVHESIHYWQQLSHGYLLALAQEDWSQMLEWEENRGRPALGSVRIHYHQPEGRNGFSASDLCESVARFWEVLLVGSAEVLRNTYDSSKNLQTKQDLMDLHRDVQTDRALDEAMYQSGNYCVPYAVARRVLDEEAGVLLFPFLAHFALKTSRPAHFFERFVEEAAPEAAAKAKELGIIPQSERAGASDLYPFLEHRCAEIVRQEGEVGLLHAPDLFQGSPLRDNYVYRWSFRRLDQLAADGDRAICLPGLERDLLATQLTPPCVRFRDRQIIGLSHFYLEHSGGAADEVLRRAEKARRECISLQKRWERFRTALTNS
jgi:hypothetical protein